MKEKYKIELVGDDDVLDELNPHVDSAAITSVDFDDIDRVTDEN